jgi:UDP-sugar transporter A1/2/3
LYIHCFRNLITELNYYYFLNSELLKALGGIIVAGTIKFADNILKTFATSNSIVLSCVLSYFVLEDTNLTPTFIVGTFAIILATFLYTTATDEKSHLLRLTGLHSVTPLKLL